MATGNQFPSKMILEKFDSTISINHTMQKLGDKHNINQIGIGIQYNLVGYLGKKHDDVLHKEILYAITITFEDSDALKTDEVANKRRVFIQEARKTFRDVGESRNGKELVLDDDALYKGMFELAYHKKNNENLFT